MEKHIPRGKLSKKEKRKLDSRKRKTAEPMTAEKRRTGGRILSVLRFCDSYSLGDLENKWKGNSS